MFFLNDNEQLLSIINWVKDIYFYYRIVEIGQKNREHAVDETVKPRAWNNRGEKGGIR